MSGAAYIDVSDAEVQNRLAELLQHLGSLEEPMRAYGEYLNLKTQAHFRENEDPFGVPWQELSEDYYEYKPYNKDKILTLDGHLSGEMTIRPSVDGLDFGSNMEYAAAHQYGFAGGGLPARPFLGLNDADKQELLDTIIDYLSL